MNGMRNKTLATIGLVAALATAPQFLQAQARQRQGGGEHQRGGGQREGGGQRDGGGRTAAPRDGGQRQAPDGGGRPAPQARGDAQRRDGDAGNPQGRAQAQARARDGQGRDGQDRARDGADRRRADGNRYGVPRVGPPPTVRDGDRRVYTQRGRNYYAYRYPSFRYGGYPSSRYYGYSYYDPYFSGDFFWAGGGWRSRSYYGGYYGGGYVSDFGKLRIQVKQRDAEVYIDGYYAGVVDDFDGVLQGLQLESGNYSVEVALPGFEPLQFDVHVTPGRTTTYKGDLLPEQP